MGYTAVFAMQKPFSSGKKARLRKLPEDPAM